MFVYKSSKSESVMKKFRFSFVGPVLTLRPQSNGPLRSDTVIATLAVDGWLLHLVQRGGPGRSAAPPSPLVAVLYVTVHSSTASVPTLKG